MTAAKIKKELKRSLSLFRYRHSLGVARLAKELAKKYGWNPQDAYIAGLVHDCAKEWPPEELIHHAKKWKLHIPGFSVIRKISPNLLHAYVSADVARRRKWISNQVQYNAVASHTLASRRMSLADKILYVADFAGYGRTFNGVEAIRTQAKKNIDAAYVNALCQKISYSLIKQKSLHPLTIQVWNDAVKRTHVSAH